MNNGSVIYMSKLWISFIQHTNMMFLINGVCYGQVWGIAFQLLGDSYNTHLDIKEIK